MCDVNITLSVDDEVSLGRAGVLGTSGVQFARIFPPLPRSTYHANLENRQEELDRATKSADPEIQRRIGEARKRSGYES